MAAQPRRREPSKTPAEERRDRLADVAARVRDDARRAPQRILDESEVPAGGE